MKRLLFSLVSLFLVFSCREEETLRELSVVEIQAGDTPLSLDGTLTENIPLDRTISVRFSQALNPQTVTSSFLLTTDGQEKAINTHLVGENQTIAIQATGPLESGQTYQLEILSSLQSSRGAAFAGRKIQFKTVAGNLELTELTIVDGEFLSNHRIQNVPTAFEATLLFNQPVDKSSLEQNTTLSGPASPGQTFS